MKIELTICPKCNKIVREVQEGGMTTRDFKYCCDIPESDMIKRVFIEIKDEKETP